MKLPGNRIRSMIGLLFFALAAAIFVVVAASCSNRGSTPVVAGTERRPAASPLPEGLLIVDVRTPEEYAAGHLAGAILLPHETATEVLSRLVPDRRAPVALYCRSGRRSGLVLEEMKSLGYVRVVNWGGFEELAKIRAAVRPSSE